MKLIIGLGNPGEKYDNSRHNLGFAVVDELVNKLDVGDWGLDKKLKCEIVKSGELILIKPQTFMNNSGMAVALVADYYKIAPEDIIVIHDNLDLMLGKIKVRKGGAAAGHHGVESVIKALGTDQFIRVRLGIGNQRSHLGEHHRVSFEAEKFVLDKFSPKEHSEIKNLVKHAVRALEILIEGGIGLAQNQFN